MSKEDEIRDLEEEIKELRKLQHSGTDMANTESTGFSVTDEIERLKKKICKLKGQGDGCTISGGRRYKKKRTTKRSRRTRRRRTTKRRRIYRK